MKNKVIIISVVLLSLVCGCQPKQDLGTQTSGISNIATPLGMVDYLKDLPAVKSVENWPNKYAPGIVITTGHYKIYTTMLEPLMLRRIPAFMESAHRNYNKQLIRPIETQIKFDIYLFGTRQQWETFTKEFTGRNSPLYMKIRKGAYYLNGSCVAYNIGRTATFAVLGHEGWHQFNSRHFTYRLPSWLDEGAATLFEASSYDKGSYRFQPGRNLTRLGALKKTLLDGRLIPLRKLIGLNPGEVVHYSNGDVIMAFYAQSYALVRFLREDNYGKRLRKYHSLLFGAVEGSWPLDPTLQEIARNRNIPLTTRWNKYVSPKLFAHYIDKDMAKIEMEYTRFCRKLVYNIRLKEEMKK